jgi:DNA-binding transcriptional regulator YbjK
MKADGTTVPAVRRRRDLVRTRAALLDAAAEVFARRGLDGATLEEIADVAGFTRGAVYHHFASKDELFLIRRQAPLAGSSSTPTTAARWRYVSNSAARRSGTRRYGPG